MEKKQYRPKILQAVSISIFYFAVIISVLTIGHGHDYQLLLEVGSMAAFLLIIFGITRKYVLNFKELFTNISEYFILVLPIFLTCIGAAIFDINMLNVINKIIPIPEVQETVFWNQIVGTVIIIPIIEEMLFRGIILRGFLKHYSPKKSIIVVALVFSLLHVNPGQFLSLFLKAILFGLLFLKTYSLYPSIFAHISYNFIVVILNYSKWFNSQWNLTKYTPLWLNLLVTSLTLIGISLLIRIFKNHKFLNQSIEMN